MFARRVLRTIIFLAKLRDVPRSAITPLWFYNSSCIRDSYPLFDWRKEDGNRVFRARGPSLDFPPSCANSLYRRDRRVKPRAPSHRCGRTSCVHLFHARWHIGTRREHPFLFVRRAKSRKAEAEYIFRCTNRNNFSRWCSYENKSSMRHASYSYIHRSIVTAMTKNQWNQ